MTDTKQEEAQSAGSFEDEGAEMPAEAASEEDASRAEECGQGSIQPKGGDQEESTSEEKKRPRDTKPKTGGALGGRGGGKKKKPKKSEEVSGATKLHRFNVGDAVLGRYPDGHWYPARIKVLKSDGRYLVDWDDGDVSNRIREDDDLDELPDDDDS